MTPSEAKTAQECFGRDGFYIHAAPALPSETLERAARGLGEVRDGVYDTGETPAGRGWNPGDDPRALCKIEQPQLANAALREALRAPLLGQLAGAVTGAERVQVWWVQGLVKPGVPDAAVAANVGWHQDWAYWRDWEEGSELFTAWLALSDVTTESGPMVFVPGSHRWGLLPGGDFFGQDQQALRAGIPIPEGETWRETPDILPPGGVSFHHRLLFHGSHQNRSDAPRLSLAIHLRTEKSRIRPESWAARYLERPEICPVIFQRP
ncbi:MAG: phytanoyl-CoA dioxygenase family protein [Armatimonadetes bacterium]|nr:phytanoyl-CoA dioxygenase family protein [Armatimonadota bacterium]